MENFTISGKVRISCEYIKEASSVAYRLSRLMINEGYLSVSFENIKDGVELEIYGECTVSNSEVIKGFFFDIQKCATKESQITVKQEDKWSWIIKLKDKPSTTMLKTIYSKNGVVVQELS